MKKGIDSLRQRMQAAVEELNFEEAKLLRDTIALMQDGASLDEAEETLLLQSMRQRPGAMGLGTGQPRPQPPQSWRPPKKPDPLTSRRS